MKRLTLHVGTHKTGTTTLQRFMLLNAQRMEDRGLCAPETPSKFPNAKRDRNAVFLRYAARHAIDGTYPIRVERFPDIDFDCLVLSDMLTVLNAIEEHDHVYLSDERIWYEAAIHPQYWVEMKRIAQEWGITDFQIVVYLRRQDQLVLSLWEQFAKQTSQKKSFGEYIGMKKIEKVLDYLTVLEQIEEVFGHESMVVRVFDRSRLIEGDICHDFCDAIGIEWDDSFEMPKNLNESLTFTVAEIKRITNKAPAVQATSNYLRSIAHRTVDASSATMGSVPLSSVPAERLQEIIDAHADDNEVIAREFLNREPGEPLFPESTKAPRDLEAFSPETVYSMCLFFAEALAVERKRGLKLERRIEALMQMLPPLPESDVSLRKRVQRLENVNDNSVFAAADRFARQTAETLNPRAMAKRLKRMSGITTASTTTQEQ